MIRQIHKIAILIALSAAVSLTGCSGGADKAGVDKDHDEATARHGHGEAHEGYGNEILLDHDRLEILGVAAEKVMPGDFADVIKVSGEIAAMPGSEGVVSARQAGIVRLAPGISEGVAVTAGRTVATVSAKGMAGGDAGEVARVAYDAAKRELDRITPLYKEGIVSTRDYNAALQRVEETRVAIGTSGGRGVGSATAPVAGVITSIAVADGQYVESGQPIATVSSNRALTLRADLPESEAASLRGITGARFRPSYSGEFIDVVQGGGTLVSSPTVSTASGGYIPVYFSLGTNESGIINGSYCEVYLLGSPRHDVLAVSEKAISEQQGKYFVYVEHEPGHYEKRPVTLGSSDGFRREILSGVKPGERIVSEGMTYVRLAETSGVMPEGHSHSH